MARALAVMQTPLMTVPRWDRALQEAIRNKQYKLRTAPGKKGGCGKASGKVPTTSEQSKKSETAAGRNRLGTVVAPSQADPAWSETTGSRAPSPQAEPSGRSQERLVDPKNASTLLVARWMQRFRNSQIEGSQTEESQTDDESRQGDTRASPNPQRTAADEITETFDVEYRPNTAIQDPAGTEEQGTGGSSRRRTGSERQHTGPDRCTNCHKAVHSAIACPRCTRCGTYGHDNKNCHWCHQCQASRCKDICPTCRSPHTHTMMCSFFQRVMKEYFADPYRSWSHRSSWFQRAIQHLRHVEAEWGAEDEEQAQEQGEKRSKGKERVGTQYPGGDGSGAGTAGGVGEMIPHRIPHQVSRGTYETALAPQRVPTLVVHRPLGAGHHQEETHHRTPLMTQATLVVREVVSRT